MIYNRREIYSGRKDELFCLITRGKKKKKRIIDFYFLSTGCAGKMPLPFTAPGKAKGDTTLSCLTAFKKPEKTKYN